MKPNFDVESYVQGHGAAPVSNRQHEWAMTCPRCNKEDKLVVNTERGIWHCWICEEYRRNWEGKKVPIQGAGGIVALVEWLEGCSREQAGVIVASGSTQSYTVDISDIGDDWKASVEPVEAVPIAPPPGWRPILTNLPYCEQRGISLQDVQHFGLTYCDTGRYRNRLIFPVWENNQLMYYQARAMWEETPGQRYIKSLNPPKTPGAVGPSDVLMNLDAAKFYPRVALVEGPIDCVHTGPSAVCSFGKKLSDRQLLKLVHAGVKAVDLMWDGPTEKEPKGAWPEMIRVAAKLSGIFDVRLVFLPRGDPGDYNRGDLDQFRAVARPAASISRLAII